MEIATDLQSILAGIQKQRESSEYEEQRNAWLARHTAQRRRSILSDSGIPRLIRVVMSDEWDDTSAYQLLRKEAGKVLKKRGHFLLAAGRPGTGKTIAICRIAIEMACSDQTCFTSARFISAPELTGSIDGDEIRRLMRTARGAGVLVLDDLGQEQRNSDRLAQVLVHRHNEGLMTLMSTNLSEKRFAEAYDVRILQRIKERGRIAICSDVVRPGVKI